MSSPAARIHHNGWCKKSSPSFSSLKHYLAIWNTEASLRIHQLDWFLHTKLFDFKSKLQVFCKKLQDGLYSRFFFYQHLFYKMHSSWISHPVKYTLIWMFHENGEIIHRDNLKIAFYFCSCYTLDSVEVHFLYFWPHHCIQHF